MHLHFPLYSSGPLPGLQRRLAHVLRSRSHLHLLFLRSSTGKKPGAQRMVAQGLLNGTHSHRRVLSLKITKLPTRQLTAMHCGGKVVGGCVGGLVGGCGGGLGGGCVGGCGGGLGGYVGGLVGGSTGFGEHPPHPLGLPVPGAWGHLGVPPHGATAGFSGWPPSEPPAATALKRGASPSARR